MALAGVYLVPYLQTGIASKADYHHNSCGWHNG